MGPGKSLCYLSIIMTITLFDGKDMEQKKPVTEKLLRQSSDIHVLETFLYGARNYNR